MIDRGPSISTRNRRADELESRRRLHDAGRPEISPSRLIEEVSRVVEACDDDTTRESGVVCEGLTIPVIWGDRRYVRAGPPRPMLRVLGPLVMIPTAAVIGSGVALWLAGPRDRLLLVLHQLTFVVWFPPGHGPSTFTSLASYASRGSRRPRSAQPTRGSTRRPYYSTPGRGDEPGGRGAGWLDECHGDNRLVPCDHFSPCRLGWRRPRSHDRHAAHPILLVRLDPGIHCEGPSQANPGRTMKLQSTKRQSTDLPINLGTGDHTHRLSGHAYLIRGCAGAPGEHFPPRGQ